MVIIDDSLGFPALVRTWLHQDGRFEVVGAAGGAGQGKAMVAELRPDLVVLDLVLPDSPDPVARVAELRALDPGVRILLVSSLQLEQLEHAGRATGADGVCHKGSNPEELVGRLYAIGSAAGRQTQNRLP